MRHLAVIKKSIDFAALVVNLEGTLNSLKAADGEQKQKIQECIEQFKVLAAVVQLQQTRLDALESHLLSVRLVNVKQAIDAETVETQAPRLLPPQKKKGKRAPKDA